MRHSTYRAMMLAAGALLAHGTARAQDAPAPAEPAAPASPGAAEPQAAGGQTYTPADFARFAPRNAYDMLEQVPGFSIQAQEQARGLGQASGNVLLNGKRISSKSDSVSDRLRRIPADNVIRIEIVDGATLDIPGLSGRVANVVAEGASGVQGQFEWNPQLPAAYSTMRWFGGSASASASLGSLDVTLGVTNDPFHGGTTGGNTFTFGSGRVEERSSTSRTVSHAPKLNTTLRRAWDDGTVASLSAAYQWEWSDTREEERVFAPPGAPAAFEQILTDSEGHNYEIGGDVEFAFGPGRLKLIGLESYRRSDFATQAVIDPDTDAPDFGSRFTLASEAGERIGRAEYGWQMAGGAWQLSGEAAFNRLDQVAGLFALDPEGAFVRIPFPAGTGGVREDRYETLLSFGRPLATGLSLQLTGGGEYSTIAQTGSDALARTFVRPKGSLSLAWQPLAGLDVSFEAARKVGQLEFADFLAEIDLTQDNTNAANNELRPEQSWELDLEFTRDLGVWGNATLHFFDNYISDFITVVPVPGGGEAVGNIDSARVYGVSVEATLRLDPLGWRGAKLDLRGQFRQSQLDDPVTGVRRGFDYLQPRNVEIDLRHDVPQTDWAWGGSFRDTRYNPYFRVAEFGFDHNIATNLQLFVEHKDVLGLTVQARVSNLLEGDSVLLRTVYAGPRPGGPRPDGPPLFVEDRRREVGRVVNFSVKGDF